MRKILILVFAAIFASAARADFLTLPIQIQYGGTSATTAVQALANLGGVRIAGDTMTGNLYVPGLNDSGVAPNFALVTDGSSNLIASSTTAIELSYVHGVTEAIQTQLNGLQPALTPGSISSTTSQLTVMGGVSVTVGPSVNLSISTANTSTTGLLASSDWNTFNAKQPAGGYITALTNDVTAAGPGSAAATVNSVGGADAGSIAAAAIALSGVTGNVLGSYVNGITANVQVQINGKQGNLTPGSISSTTSQVMVSGGSGATIGSNVTISVQTATSILTGLLTSSDWNTFNIGAGLAGTAVQRAGDTMSGGLQAPSFTATGAVSGNTVSATTLVSGNAVSAATLVSGNAVSAATLVSGNTVSAATTLSAATVNVSGLSASELVATDGGKNLVSQSTGNLLSSTNQLSVSGGTGAVVGTGVSLSITTATASLTGLLASSDWNTFNGKAPAFSQSALSGQGTVNVSSSPQIIGSSPAVITVTTAGASSNGVLTQTDWNTFNAKQPAGSYITALTNDVTAAGPGSASATVNSVGGASASNIAAASNALTGVTGTLLGSYVNGITANVQAQLNTKQVNLTPGTISSTTTQLMVSGGSGATVGPSVSFSISTATSTLTGLLTSSDWSNFNTVYNALQGVTYTGGQLATYLAGLTANVQGQINGLGSTYANVTLSNLTSPTAINQNLLPASFGLALGSSSAPWQAYVNGEFIYAGIFGSTSSSNAIFDLSGAPVFRLNDDGGVRVVSWSASTRGLYNTSGVQTVDFSGANPKFLASPNTSDGLQYEIAGTAALSVGTGVGAENTLVGISAAPGITTGQKNTVLGYSSGYSLTTGNQNTLVGVSSNAAASAVAAIGLGYQAVANASGAAQIGTGTNGTANTLQFQTYNFLTNTGAASFTNVNDSSLTASQLVQTDAAKNLVSTDVLPSDTTGSTVNFSGLATLGSVTVPSTTDSSSPTTGSVVTAGGMGIAKSLNVGGSNLLTLGVGTNTGAQNSNEYASILYSPTSPLPATQKAFTSASNLTGSTQNTHNVIGGGSVIERTITGVSVSDSGGLFANFAQMSINNGTNPYTNTSAYVAAYRVPSTTLGTGPVTLNYSGIGFDADSSAFVGNKSFILFQALSGGTNSAYIADNTAYSGNWFINQSGTDPSTFAGNLSVSSNTAKIILNQGGGGNDYLQADTGGTPDLLVYAGNNLGIRVPYNGGEVYFPNGVTTTVINDSGTLTAGGALVVTGGIYSGSNLYVAGGVTVTGALVSATVTDGALTSGLVASSGAGLLQAATSGNVTSALGYTPVNRAGDSMSGALQIGANLGVSGQVSVGTAGNISINVSTALGFVAAGPETFSKQRSAFGTSVSPVDDVALMLTNNASTTLNQYASMNFYNSFTSNSASWIAWSTTNSGGTNTEQMTLDQNGKLTVLGGVTTSGSVNVSGAITGNNATQFYGNSGNANGFTPVDALQGVTSGSNIEAALQVQGQATTNTQFKLFDNPVARTMGLWGNSGTGNDVFEIGYGSTLRFSMDLNSDGHAIFDSTVDSTSTATGAVQILGGLGVAKTITGATVNVTGKLALANGSAFANAPESYMPFSTGALTTVGSNEIVGSGKTTRAMTIENGVGAAATFTCSTNPVLTLLDCGTSAGACTSGTTTLVGVTLAAANTQTNGGALAASTIAAGHFWAWELTAGACTVLNASGSAEAAMQ